MLARTLMIGIISIGLFAQCKKQVATTMPEVGDYEFKINIKDYDTSGRLTSESDITVNAEFSLCPTEDTLTIKFDQYAFEPIKLVKDGKGQLLVIDVPESYTVNSLASGKSLLKYKLVHRLQIKQFFFDGHKI